VADLFREEALEHHARFRGPGDVLRLAPPWTSRLYWLLLVLVAVGLAAAWFVRIDGDRLLTVLFGGG
jgi:hypothetical protein